MAETADQVAEDSRPEEPRVTLAEAAAMTGRPPEAIRAMIRRGKLRAIKGNDGRTLVTIPAELRQPTGQPGNGRTSRGGGRGDGYDGRTAAQDGAEDGRVATLEMAVEEWRAAAEEARLEAAVAAAEREAARATATAEVEAMRRQMEAELAAKDAVVAEFRAMLADARRPWWRRWALNR